MSEFKVGRDISNLKRPINSYQVMSWLLTLIIAVLALIFLFSISGYLCSDIVAGQCV